MAELAESKMNFAALNKVDPYAKSLLETAAHVALYTFVDNREWVKTDIEGTLFVYSRTGEPFHNILIMNRLNMDNLVEPVTEGLDLQLQDPFLLYRNSKRLIYGIWFYDKKECVKIASILTQIIKEAGQAKKDKNTIGICSRPTNVDIFSMLTKAQEEYNSKSPGKPQIGLDGFGLGPHDLNYNINGTDPTPQCVMDFFAKAGRPNGAKFINEIVTSQPPGMFVKGSCSGLSLGLPRMQSVPIAIPPPQTDVKPLLQRLMSNPAHSVEHIEKQQQAVTPQNEFVGLIRNGNSIVSSNPSSRESRNNSSFSLKQSGDSNPGKENGLPVSAVIGQGNFDNKVGFLRISDSPPTTVHTQQFFNSKLKHNHSPLVSDVPLESNTKLVDSQTLVESQRPLSAPMETQSKPALMPPVMFTSSAKREDNESLSTSPSIALLPTSANTSLPVRPEPLTKNQLLQAVNYLLKHDQDFMNKLHEAYVKSFAELVQ